MIIFYYLTRIIVPIMVSVIAINRDHMCNETFLLLDGAICQVTVISKSIFKSSLRVLIFNLFNPRGIILSVFQRLKASHQGDLELFYGNTVALADAAVQHLCESGFDPDVG